MFFECENALKSETALSAVRVTHNSDALHDLVPFAHFKKTWKTPMEEYYF